MVSTRENYVALMYVFVEKAQAEFVVFCLITATKVVGEMYASVVVLLYFHGDVRRSDAAFLAEKFDVKCFFHAVDDGDDFSFSTGLSAEFL